MKKYLIALVALLVVATGCGNSKKLTCTMTEDGAKEEIVMTYKKDDLAKIEMTSTTVSEEEISKDEIAMYEGFVCGMLNAMSEQVDCKVSAKGKELTMKVTMNIEKMTAEELEELGYKAEETSYEDMKKAAEEDGYTCK